MNKKKLVISIVTASILLIGCGGGSSSSSTSTSTSTKNKEITGKVIDPAIKGAKVTLNCGSDIFVANSKTNEKGEFIISLPNATDTSTCILEAKGGKDGADDLTGLSLKTSYKLFNSDKGIYITPFTTAITSHNSDDIETAKREVAAFLNVKVGDLLKDPTSNIELTKVSKKLTKLAMKKDITGKAFGYLDIDDDVKTTSTFDEFITSELKLSSENKNKLKNEFKAIKASNNIDDLQKNSALGNTLYLLEKAYKIDSDSEIKENLKALALTIINANKDGKNYKYINQQHIRKALADLNLTPSFTAEGTFSDALLAELKKDEADFKTDVLSKKINIKNIEGITLFNTNTYEQVLGDDNAKRVQYYMFSEKSHIGKAYELIKNTYDDSLLNSAYTDIAKGFAKAGLYDDAMNIIQNNIYGSTAKFDAYNKLANVLSTHKQYEKAIVLLEQNYIQMKKNIEAKGKGNLTFEDFTSVLDFAFSYYNNKNDTKANEVFTYLNENIVTNVNDKNASGTLTVVYKNLILDLLDENKIVEAKKLFAIAANYVKNQNDTETNVKAVVNNIMFIAHIGPILKENKKTSELLELIKSLDTKYNTSLSELTAGNYTGDNNTYATKAGMMSAITALNGDLSKVENLIKNAGIIKLVNTSMSWEDAKYEKVNDLEIATINGLVASYFINNKDEEGMDLLYENRPSKEYEVKFNTGNQIFRKYVPNTIPAYLDTARILKAYDKNIMARFFDALVKDMKTRPWVLRDRHIASYVLSERFGLPVIIKHYDSVNETEKRDSVLEEAITIANNMTNEIYKLQAYQAILSIVNELDLEKTSNINALTNNINTLVSAVTLDPYARDYAKKFKETIIQSKNLAKYATKEEAKTLLNTAIDSLHDNVDGNKDYIDWRVTYILGDTYPQNSIIDGLIQAKEYDRAEKLIDEIAEDISTLGQSLDTSMPYVKVVRAYASINNLEKIKETLAKIITLKERNLAKRLAISYLSNFNAFNSNIAFVDSDGDFKADFFTLGTSQEEIDASGIILDDDIDNDGILDSEDKLPYLKQ